MTIRALWLYIVVLLFIWWVGMITAVGWVLDAWKP